jgi:hypothetical protein
MWSVRNSRICHLLCKPAARNRPASRLLAFLLAGLAALGPAMAAELQKRVDLEGNIHFGTADEADLCCMCRRAAGFEFRSGKTLFRLNHGIDRVVSNSDVYLSADGEAWYCEGVREQGALGRKCGLVPQLN